MSSNEQASTSSSPQQQQQPRIHKPPFADWPTIKILTPPQGPFLPKVDEWCFTYCSQTVSGRINRREPNCHTLCIRKVFPHEVRNILAFKRHHSVGPDGKATYPLPAEGQPTNIPRILGGQPKDDSEDAPKPSSPPTKYWDEGWYLWSGQGRWSFLQKTEKMMLDLQSQQQVDAVRESRKELWHDYQEKLKQNPGQQTKSPPLATQWWAPIVPPKSISDATSSSLLIPIPPDIPAVWDTGRIRKLLAPSQQVLEILHESITSGEQKEFALRIWEKARSEEPWILAQRSLSRAYERWKKPDIAEEDDGKTGSA
ncbi:hypothetical protein BJ912DRAFT_884522 [Pholiota molesta]|nr:hypothetical protein BJ912DRAFT_884522 [Pholiota molesta]